MTTQTEIQTEVEKAPNILKTFKNSGNRNVNETGVFEHVNRDKIYILHHDDADGWGAGAICHSSTSENKYETKIFAVNYNQPFPFDVEILTSKDKVFILDFSYPKEILEDIHKRVERLIVLDHHKSAIGLADLPYVVFNLKKSGVLLAWDYFVPEYPAPESVQLLDCYDLWKKNDPKHSWEKVVAFHFACMEGLKKDMQAWVGMLNGYVIPNNFWELGYAHLHNLQEAIKAIKESPSTEIVEVNNKRYCLFFAEDMISLVSDGLYNDPELNVVGTGCLFKRKDKWVVSLRSKTVEDFNARLFAESLDGGGHDLSAGAVIGSNEDEIEILDKLKDELIKFNS